MTIDIHGKQYKTVAERVNEAHNDKDLLSVTTEVLAHNPVVIKATVLTKLGSFSGISAADPSKAIEKKSPYEVAETSAVGRALAFAGYAGTEIASYDEMVKAGAVKRTTVKRNVEMDLDEPPFNEKGIFQDENLTDKDPMGL